MTKLLAMRMVANKVLGFSFRAIIRLLELCSSCSKVARSLGEREKNAISLPEMRAEEQIIKIKRTNENSTPLVNKAKAAKKQKCKKLEGGSVSNFYVLVRNGSTGSLTG